MKRRVSILVLFLSAALCGYSQLSWNVKAGANLSGVTEWETADLKPGYQLGVGMDYYFTSHWGVQTSLMLISKGYKMKGDYYNPNPGSTPTAKSYDQTQNRMYLELPIMLAYRLHISDNSKLVFNGGGYAGYGIGGKSKNKITLTDGSQQKESESTFSAGGVKEFDAGLGAGINYEYKRYFIGVFGEWGLLEVDNVTKNKTYGLDIGYKF